MCILLLFHHNYDLLFSMTQDLQSHRRSSFSSSASDNSQLQTRRVEFAYSFVGMHCIFDQCKAAGKLSLKKKSEPIIWLFQISYQHEVAYIRRLIVNSAVMVVKFGHMSSDLLAYGASDGTLTVCNVSEPSSSVKQLLGHSKDVTGWIGWYCFFVFYTVSSPNHNFKDC